MSVTPLNRTLEQELAGLIRGVSLECLVCGEFVLHQGPVVRCPECGSSVSAAVESEEAPLHWSSQAG